MAAILTHTVLDRYAVGSDETPTTRPGFASAVADYVEYPP
jgi:hypothetical protein